MEMKTIKDTFNKNGYSYILEKREGTIALYSMINKHGSKAYEVHKVRTVPQRALKGVTLEASERLAGNEDFGKYGWSYSTEENAMIKYNELVQ